MTPYHSLKSKTILLINNDNVNICLLSNVVHRKVLETKHDMGWDFSCVKQQQHLSKTLLYNITDEVPSKTLLYIKNHDIPGIGTLSVVSLLSVRFFRKNILFCCF